MSKHQVSPRTAQQVLAALQKAPCTYAELELLLAPEEDAHDLHALLQGLEAKTAIEQVNGRYQLRSLTAPLRRRDARKD